MRRVMAYFLGSVVCASTAMATNLNVSVKSGGLNSINVSGGAVVNYVVEGTLSDTLNDGLALVGFDLEFTGGVLAGPLPQANEPTSGNMVNFDIPAGITNPAGFGGTPDPGNPNKLLQVGGGQNTIKNCPDDINCPCQPSCAPYPSGTVIPNVAQSTIVLAAGSFNAPVADGTYSLVLSNLFANVIKDNEVGTVFFATEAAGVGSINNLSITVGSCATAVASTSPVNCSIDARQPSNLDGSNPALPNAMTFTFTNACVCAGAGLCDAADFTVAQTGGGGPGVANVSVNGAAATVNLTARITPGKWTCVTHVPSGIQRCMGTLPADASGDRNSTAGDIITLINHLNNVGVPLPIERCDMDRSGGCGAPDIIRLIDLLNGASTFDPWLGLSLPVCPSP